MNDNKYGAIFLVFLVIVIFIMVLYSPRTPTLNMQQKLKNSEYRADSLQEILNKYEVIKPEAIKLYYNEKYKNLHNEVDTNTLNSNVELLIQLLSE